MNDQATTSDNVLLIVIAAGALAAVVVGFVVAAASRLPHLGVVATVTVALALALIAVPRIDNAQRFDVWEALGHHYVPNEAYGVACGNDDLYVESAPAPVMPTPPR